jgi:hypothetical protein
MAWTNIPNANLAAGAPIRSVDLIALRDNIPAVADGLSGAPKIKTNGINDLAVTTAKLGNSQVTTAKIGDSQVTTAKLGNNQVTTVKLATNEQMTTANVLARTAGATASAVGTYMLARRTSGSQVNFGATTAGNTLQPCPATGGSSSGVQSGTWRCMGFVNTFSNCDPSSHYTTVWLRIS